MTATTTAHTLRLRDYQVEAIEAVHADWGRGITPTAVVLPTGMGKTVIFSDIAREWFETFRTRVLVLVHRDELAQQAVNKLRALCGDGLTVGRVQAEHDDIDADVIVASVQTLRNPRRMDMVRNVGMIIIDECHHAMATSYQDILRHYGAITDDHLSDTPCVGFTATLERSDGIGLGTLFENVAYTRDIMYGIKHGYLADVRGLTIVSEGIDLSKIRRSHGDYAEGELGAMIGQEIVCRATADAYLEHGEDRPGVLFAPTVESAYAMSGAFCRAGVASEVIEGNTPIHERAAIFHRFRTGETRVLANCMVLTEGWDEPCASVAIWCRPTMSTGLYQQGIGRVLRPFPGKGKALVLDVVGSARQHKLASLIDMSVWTPKDGESLLDAEERELADESEGWGEEKTRKARGPKWEKDGGLTEVNLFAESSTAWLQTRKGVWFINTRATTWFLWENTTDGTYGIATYRNADYAGRPTLHQIGLPMALAMGIAEGEAIRADPSIASRAASWRRGNVEPTQPQRDMMDKWRIERPEGMTKNEASDAISVAVASSRIDRYVR